LARRYASLHPDNIPPYGACGGHEIRRGDTGQADLNARASMRRRAAGPLASTHARPTGREPS